MGRLFSLASVSVLALGVGLSAMAEDKKPEPAQPATPKVSPNADAINRMMAAHAMADYGRDKKSAVALLAAAQVLADTPTQPFRDLFKDDPKAQAEIDKETVKPADDPDSPDNLIKDAKTLAGDDATTLALVKQVEKQIAEGKRNLIGGAFTGTFFMDPGEKALYPGNFAGGQQAEVNARVIGGGQMSLSASDPKEGVDEHDFGTVCHVSWFQRADGRVNIIRKNESNGPIKVYLYVP